MELDVSKKIEGIMRSHTLDDLSLKFLPPVSDTPDNYYFISYSHLDYKRVYSDIFALQLQGVNVWYDRGMPAGVSWKETAEKYIRPSRCVGVVFYVSENSLLSPAIHEEMAFAKKCGKSCLTINIPPEGNSVCSAKDMLDEMIKNGADVQKDKYDFVAEYFNSEVLFIDISAKSDFKAEKILKLKKPPILQFCVKGDNQVFVEAVGDIEVQKIEEKDFFFVDTDSGETANANLIGECAFANCKRLETVELPNDCIIIRKYAFYGCSALKSINLNRVCMIGECAFFDCQNLRYVDLRYSNIRRIKRSSFWNCSKLKIDLPKNLEHIEDYAFGGCTGNFVLPAQLKSIGKKVFSDGADITFDGEGNYFVENNCLIEKSSNTVICGNNRSVIPSNILGLRIGEQSFMASEISEIAVPENVVSIETEAFYLCPKLKRVFVSDNVRIIGNNCFSNCPLLEEVIMPDSSVSIGDKAFYECRNLKKVVIGSKTEYIGKRAFGSLHSSKNVLTELVFNGNMSEWEKIEKNEEWNYDSNIKKIICSDGEIILQRNK